MARGIPLLRGACLTADQLFWHGMSVPERREHVLSQLLGGETQTLMAARYGVSLANISLRAREAFNASDVRFTHPTLLKCSRAAEERFWDFVLPEPNSGCWLFFGSDNGAGYGIYSDKGGKKNEYAHRIAYKELVGPIPAGLELDHLCNTRCCCNPGHLEPVTSAENKRRAARRGAFFNRNHEKTHCPSGHPYSGENLIIKKLKAGRQYRACRACEAQAHHRYRVKTKAAA